MDIINYEELKKELRKRREKLGLTMNDLAFYIRMKHPDVRISSATISRVEGGQQKDTNYKTLYYWLDTLKELEEEKR